MPLLLLTVLYEMLKAFTSRPIAMNSYGIKYNNTLLDTEAGAQGWKVETIISLIKINKTKTKNFP